MNFLNKLFGRYANHPEAVVISCYFNPMKAPYRTKAFNHFYNTIKHLNHYIVECVIGDSKPELKTSDSIERIYAQDLLWHKESILNYIVAKLPKKYKYVFWVDADVIFTNKNWLTDGVEELTWAKIIQPFEYCVHLDKDQEKPSFDVEPFKRLCNSSHGRHPKVWRSFCATEVETHFGSHSNYDKHGHVGFAWGARREVLDSMPLYDKALIGGADHIIAHAAAGHIPHSCITKSFRDDLAAVNAWSVQFYNEVRGSIGYVKGDLFHIWHGDIEKRQYLKRIQDFTPKAKEIKDKDKNGLYISRGSGLNYMRNYFQQREVLDPMDLMNPLNPLSPFYHNPMNDGVFMQQLIDEAPPAPVECAPDCSQDNSCGAGCGCGCNDSGSNTDNGTNDNSADNSTSENFS